MSIAVSAELAAAIEADERTPLVRVMVDWDGDGFGPAGSIDDLSGRVGAVTVDRSLLTDMPESVRIVEGTAAATGQVELAEGDPTDETMHPARYYTRGTDSPIGAKERVGRPAFVDIGFVTSSGPQYVRRLTGQTRKFVTGSRGRTAAMGLLDNRAGLRDTVQLVPVDGTTSGCDGTFVVTQALYAAGIGAGPLPRSQGLILWAPMYGSVSPIRSDASAVFRSGFSNPTPSTLRPTFRTGPFVLAADPHYTSAGDYATLSITSSPPVAANWTALQGRLEMWVLGVASPTTSAGRARTYALITSSFVSPFVRFGLAHSGSMWIEFSDSSDTPVLSYSSTATVPNDGLWHAVGLHYDVTAQTITIRIDNRFETQVLGVATPDMVPWMPNTLLFSSSSPVSDVFIHDVPDATSWLADTVVIGAVLDPSLLQLQACYEGAPREPWGLITEVAAAEQAIAQFDEPGVFRYRTRARLTTPSGQTVQRVMTTVDASLLDVTIDDGVDQVRNIVQVTYNPVDVTGRFTIVYADQVQRVLQARTTLDVTLTFGQPALQLELGTTLFSVGGFNALYPSPSIPGSAYLVATTNAAFSDDGGAILAYDPLIDASVLSWTAGAVKMRITNNSPAVIYITQIGLRGTNAIVGGGVVTEARSVASVNTYGPQPLQMTGSQWVQSADVAQSLANAILGDVQDPHPQVSGLQVVGDPRRQLGDRVLLADPDGTQLDGEFWLTAIQDTVDPSGAYTQTVSARGATSLLRWDVGHWDLDTWS